MLSRVVRNLKGVKLEAAVTLSDVVDAGDVGAHFVHNLHELQNNREHKALASRCSHICIKWDIKNSRPLINDVMLTRWIKM